MSPGLAVGPPEPHQDPKNLQHCQVGPCGECCHHQWLDCGVAGLQVSPLGLGTGRTCDTVCEGLGCRAWENPASWQPLCGESCYWVSCSVHSPDSVCTQSVP